MCVLSIVISALRILILAGVSIRHCFSLSAKFEFCVGFAFYLRWFYDSGNGVDLQYQYNWIAMPGVVDLLILVGSIFRSVNLRLVAFLLRFRKARPRWS